METVIRHYRETDEPAVVRLSLRAWAPVYASMKALMGEEISTRLWGGDWRHDQQREVEKALRDDEAEVWVAELHGEVVGFATAAVVDPDRHMGEIHMIAVDPDAQNRGVGAQLTEVATEGLREAGMSIILISTGGDVGHAPARRTYEKAGFTPMPIVNYFKSL